MKLFVVQEGECQGEFDKLTGDITTLLITICQRLMRRPKVQLVHTALFLLHCQAKVSSYHSFDRFMYSCAAILVASKLTEHIEFYPIHILKALRIILRQQRGISQPDEQDQEEQTKLKMLTKRLFEAEVNLMINIGFDFDIELGLFWLQEWSRSIGDSHVLRKTEEAMTSFYQTTAVLYFQPQVVAMACLSIVMKNEGINPALCGWDPALLALLGDNEERIKEAKNMYLSRQRYRYS